MINVDFPIQKLYFKFKTFGTANVSLVINNKKYQNVNDIVLDNISDSENTIKIIFDKTDSTDVSSYAILEKFEINSVQLLYSLPVDSFVLINDEKDKIYLAKIKKYNDIKINKDTKEYKSFISKENTRIRNSILKSYDFLLNDKYNVNVNQIALNNVKNLFQ